MTSKTSPKVSPDNVEFEVLKSRIKLGNEKLWKAWEQIKGIAHETKEWSYQMDRWSEAKETLWLLVTELKAKHNFHDCLYIENGVKTRGCLHNQDGFFCQVCPCETDNKYWEKELMDLPGPRRAQTKTEQADFIEELGKI